MDEDSAVGLAALDRAILPAGTHMSEPERPSDPTYCSYTEYEHGDVPDGTDVPATGQNATGAERAVWDELYDIEDPEMPVSIVDLGLIYGVTVEDGIATVQMTLTYTGCPARDLLLSQVETAAARPEGVEAASVELVWSPEWTLEMVTEAGKESLREFGVSI